MPLPFSSTAVVYYTGQPSDVITLNFSDLNKTIIFSNDNPSFYLNSRNNNQVYLALPLNSLIGKNFGNLKSFQFNIQNNSFGFIRFARDISNTDLQFPNEESDNMFTIFPNTISKFQGVINQIKVGAVITYKIKIFLIGYN